MFSGKTVSPERALDVYDKARSFREAADAALLVLVMGPQPPEALPVETLRACMTFHAVAQRLEEIAAHSTSGLSSH